MEDVITKYVRLSVKGGMTRKRHEAYGGTGLRVIERKMLCDYHQFVLRIGKFVYGNRERDSERRTHMRNAFDS